MRQRFVCQKKQLQCSYPDIHSFDQMAHICEYLALAALLFLLAFVYQTVGEVQNRKNFC